MKSPFTASRVQIWRLVGVSCWHRTLIQQQAGHLRKRWIESTPGLPQFLWRWDESLSDVDREGSSAHATEEWAGEEWDVLIISREKMEQIAESQKKSESGASIADPWNTIWPWQSSHRIGLLWDWTPMACLSFAWANPLGFSGVISDPRSLRHWMQVLMTRGRARVQPAHPLLRSITIPTLRITKK